MPQIRTSPEDFVVDEIPLYEPSGAGGHTFVRVEKRRRTTEEVARELAREAGVAAREVGYAGRKDREAITRQWFSVPGLDPERALSLELRDARVLEAIPHRHKLRTGQLRANRFEIVVREVDADDLQRAQSRAADLSRCGMPNRFGEQRFGRDADNAERALALLRGDAHARDRRDARFLFSALQAQVFNRVLEERPLPLDRVETGDVALVVASGGPFLVEDETRENERAARFEISPTGPIFGTRCLRPFGRPAEREAAALAACRVPPPDELQLPRGIRLRGTRRALRVPVADLRLAPREGALLLCFTLPPGSYATVLVDELGLSPPDSG